MVQTFPEHPARSEWMAIFVKGYLGKKYGVRAVSPSPSVTSHAVPASEIYTTEYLQGWAKEWALGCVN